MKSSPWLPNFLYPLYILILYTYFIYTLLHLVICYLAVPSKVYDINQLVLDEKRGDMTVDFGSSDSEDKWWELLDLTKLYLSSNKISSIDADIANLTTLTLLDVINCFFYILYLMPNKYGGSIFFHIYMRSIYYIYT